MPGELLFVVSADGVTEDGADCLEACWAWFIDRGLWRYQQQLEVGEMLVTTYHLRDLGDAAAEVETWPGRVDCYVSPAHFARASVCGLQTAARASVRCGWRYYSGAGAPLAQTG